MSDILQDLPIKAPIQRVFDAISTPEGLNAWWTLTCKGTPRAGAQFELDFGPEYVWQAKVRQCEAPVLFELEMTRADEDWLGSRVTFRLQEKGEATWLQFAHTGWTTPNEHYRISSHCWAMYLRILRRSIEYGEVVPYKDRLEV
ncbi:MAG: SRPBCC domain-containing protein [Gemmatimonadaceae bacterium]